MKRNEAWTVLTVLLTKINISTLMDKWSHDLLNVGWNYLSIHLNCLSNFIPRYIVDVIAFPCWNKFNRYQLKAMESKHTLVVIGQPGGCRFPGARLNIPCTRASATFKLIRWLKMVLCILLHSMHDIAVIKHTWSRVVGWSGNHETPLNWKWKWTHWKML